MQSIVDESPFKIKYNLKDWITNWTLLNNYPVINVKRNYDTSSLNISIENFNTNISIHGNVITRTHSDLKKFLPAVRLASHVSYHTLTIDFIDKNDWILINLQQSGNKIFINIYW